MTTPSASRTTPLFRLVSPIVILLAAIVLLPLSAFSQKRPDTSEGRGAKIAGPIHGLKIPRDQANARLLAAHAGSVKLVIELEDPSTIDTYARAQSSGASVSSAEASAQQQLARVERAQQQFVRALAPLGATVIYRVQRVYNGVAVQVDASQVAALAALPGVKSVSPLVSKHLDNASSVPLIGAPQVWGGSANAAGDNIKIAIIDSGIDYLHPDFGGPGTQAAYDAINTTVTGAAFPTAKVVGGYDFVGDDYDGTNTAQPDPNPIDCVKIPNPGNEGHGSHVAGTAAGFGVNANGTTYTGPYNNSINFGSFRIGPGVAPKALLYAFRVFGCDGATDFADKAIEAAVDPNGDGNPADHVDVINMSLGSSYGDANDSTSKASDAAVKAGVVVVASAGNSGDTNYIVGSPSTASGVISVASSADAGAVLDGFKVNTPPALTGVYTSSNSVNYSWDGKPDITADLVYPPDQRSGCAAFSPANKALLAGKIALLDWTTGACGSAVRTNNAADAGAVGLILAYDRPVLDIAIAGSARIPATITLQSVGAALKAALAGGAVNVTLTGSLINATRYNLPGLADTLSSFSSRGVRNGDGVLKPDITAPGQTIFSVKIGPGGRGQSLNGTSMAAPHVAGAMALLKQTHPSYSVAELKALAMNTATKDIRVDQALDSQIYGPARVGAGRIDVVAGAAGQVVAFNTARPDLVSVSFGNLQVVTTTTVLKTVTVVNKGTGSATFDVAYNPVATIPGAVYSVTPATVTLAGGASATVNVSLSVDATKTRHTHDPSLSEEQVGLARVWQSEASGYLTMTPQTTTTSNFKALIRGYYENPPIATDVEASGTFTYTASSKAVAYAIRFSDPITLTMAHFHIGKAGENGPVTKPIPLPGGNNVVSSLVGSVTLSDAEAALLLNGSLYVNFHTAANPNGELRGQVVAAAPVLRVPVHAAVRAASATKASAASLKLKSTSPLSSTGVISLTGDDVLNVADPTKPLNGAPLDDVSVVSAFELQARSPQLANSTPLTASTDLRYVGVTSDFRSTITAGKPTGVVSDTSLYFGIATYGDWTTPGLQEFDVYLDVDRNGVSDYALFNTTVASGADPTDVHVTALCPVDKNGACTDDATVEAYVNTVDPGTLNTNVLDNSVIVLPVYVSDIPELVAGASRFTYSVESYDSRYGPTDKTGTLTYDAAHPGIDVSNANASFGPAHLDVNGGTIPFTFNSGAYGLNRSQGVLLLHHHGASASTRAEVLTAPVTVLLPIVAKP